MVQLTLWFTVIFGWLALIFCYRRIGLVHLASVGLTAYTVPALLGITTTISTPTIPGQIYPVSAESTLAMLVVWVGFLVALTLGLVFRANWIRPLDAPYDRQARNFLTMAHLGAWFFYIYISALSHPLFFLQDRDVFYSGFGVDLIIWRWVVAAGLIGATLWRRSFLLAVFVFHMAIVAITGDRTVPLIAVVASFTIAFWGRSFIRTAVSPWAWLAVSGVVAGIFFIKPAYAALKSGSSIWVTIFTMSPRTLLMQWEAFTTHEILEKVISEEFRYSLSEMVAGSFAQLLVVPSAFGFRSSEFNAQVQPVLFPDVAFGIAENHWAQWYAVAGWLGLVIGGLAFGLVVIIMQNGVQRWLGVWKILALMLGSIVAAYCYRNSVENTLAFWRQAALAFVFLTIASTAVYYLLTMASQRSRGGSRST